ncbi:MAG: YggS family pyridoxal phosphate-dependent enzyme [Candidatus Omnitrophota bacterium]
MTSDNIIKIKGRISSACAKVNRGPASVTIVAVTKNRSIEQVKEAVAAGIADIGENRVQEALIKFRGLSAIEQRPAAIKWHMVGHLQANKVKTAVKIFDLIHSVDSIALAREIDRQAAAINKIQEILVEVKTSPEESKFGIKPDEAVEVIKEISKLKNLNLGGLMTIAPLVDNPEKARPYFRLLRELRDKINSLMTLSMGMTDDFEVAIEEGATMIRLGRALFD